MACGPWKVQDASPVFWKGLPGDSTPEARLHLPSPGDTGALPGVLWGVEPWGVSPGDGLAPGAWNVVC